MTNTISKVNTKYKGRHQLNLVEEKRAFVVIALTDKLSLTGKLVALNALAHYNSERGYSWASIPVVAKESGYSPTSTKSISPGFEEIERVGAFKVVRNPPSQGSKSSTHRCCPVMSWFGDEYQRLRLAGKVDQDNTDPFADIRVGGDERQGSRPDGRQGSQPLTQGPRPGQIGSTTRSDRVRNPVRQGPQPDEENRPKGTDRSEQTQTSANACGEPVDHYVSDRPRTKPGNDNEPAANVEQWPSDMAGAVLKAYPRGGNRKEVHRVLAEIEREGKTEFRDIMRGIRNYAAEMGDTELRYVKWPENFLKERFWEGYQRDRRPKSAAAI